MHSFKGKLAAILAILVVLGLVVSLAYTGKQIVINRGETSDTEETEEIVKDKDTLILWYTDAALTDYLNSAAVSYSTENGNIRVIPELVSGREYLETISNESVKNHNFPDMYITTHDLLEKAHLAGLADKINAPGDYDLNALFPETAINSVTYQGKVVAYPLYYECSALLYNKTYFDNWAVAYAEAEIDTEEGEAAQAAIDSGDASALQAAEEVTIDENAMNADEEVVADAVEEDPERVARVEKRSAELKAEYFPSTMEGLLTFSDMYDAPENVEGIFKWAVNDIFYNYFVIGGTIDVGGKYGDDAECVDIYNENTIRALMDYQALNQFFSINTDEVSYSQCLSEFTEGKMLFTIATTDAIKMLKQAKDEGTIDFEYAFATLPGMTENVDARSMSVTNGIAINGYSTNQTAANDFAAYLSTLDGASLYERTGKASVLKNADYGSENDYLASFMAEYEKSAPLPKMIETSNLWVNLELLFASVWDGEDANKGLKQLSEQMMLQITGEEYTEEPIEIIIEQEEEEEIIEEESDASAEDSEQ